MSSSSVFPFPFLSSLVSKAPDMTALLLGRTQFQFPPMSRLLPYSMDGPFKQSMNFFMRLAWSSKIQLPVLIAVCFMAFDIRLQLEINIFWEANHRQNMDDRLDGYDLDGLQDEMPGDININEDSDSEFDSTFTPAEDDDDSESIVSRVSSSNSVLYIDDSDCLDSDNDNSSPPPPDDTVNANETLK